MKLFLLSALTLPSSVTSFTLPTSIINPHNGLYSNYYHASTKLMSTSEPSNEIDNDDQQESEPPQPPAISNPGGSDLKALLPTPKKRTLTLDKFGRRVHDLTDDGTAKFSKELRGVAPDEYVVPPALKSEKELAADASSADFSAGVSSSADLKALLPTQKMRFMKLDKFGRRIQRMEDDGTVNMRKEPTQQSQTPAEVPFTNTPQPQDIKMKTSTSQPRDLPKSQSLAKLLSAQDNKEGRGGVIHRENSDAVLGEGNKSVDLKELLPKQKMRFMKLDKFGRRVQRMEDDGTVNFQKEPSSSIPLSSTLPTSAVEDVGEPDAVVDLGSEEQLPSIVSEDDPDATEQPNYGSLKDLLPTRRPTWTKLDFKGGSVVDESRVKTMSGSESASDVDVSKPLSGQGLKDLLPKRATWTKLDFHGASVVDERRIKQAGGTSSGKSNFNEGQYSNLKTLLPQRTITWKKNQVLSSGSAPTVSENVRGLREERQQAMRDEVIASASRNAPGNNDVVDGGEDIVTEEELKPYTNLKDLLPERKMTWRSTK